MGYDLHIVRTRDWLDRDQHPILKSEVDALVAVDPELAWSETDYAEVRNPDTGEVVRSYGLFCKWRGGEAVFWCYGGEITLKNPTVTEQIKMVKMADALKAMVVGDDGERYSIRKNFFGKERLVVET